MATLDSAERSKRYRSWVYIRVSLLLSTICLSAFQCWKTADISFYQPSEADHSVGLFERVKATVISAGFEKVDEFDNADATVARFTTGRRASDTKAVGSGVVVRYDKESGETTLRFSQLRPLTTEGKEQYKSLVRNLRRRFGNDVVHADELN